MAEIKNEPFFL
jgi:hypothetical protein